MGYRCVPLQSSTPSALKEKELEGRGQNGTPTESFLYLLWYGSLNNPSLLTIYSSFNLLLWFEHLENEGKEGGLQKLEGWWCPLFFERFCTIWDYRRRAGELPELNIRNTPADLSPIPDWFEYIFWKFGCGRNKPRWLPGFLLLLLFL